MTLLLVDDTTGRKEDLTVLVLQFARGELDNGFGVFCGGWIVVVGQVVVVVTSVGKVIAAVAVVVAIVLPSRQFGQ